MTSIYGHYFKNVFGTSDGGIWREMLEGISVSSLDSGLKKIKEVNSGYEKYPPNPLQFKEICSKFEGIGVPKAHKNYVMPVESEAQRFSAEKNVDILAKQVRNTKGNVKFTLEGLLSGEELRYAVLTTGEHRKAMKLLGEYIKLTPYLMFSYVLHCRKGGNIRSFCKEKGLDVADYQ